MPTIATGDTLTVTTTLVVQPVVNVYTMVDVPVPIPVANPEDDPIITADVLLLVQVPPVIASLNEVPNPTHKISELDTIGETGFTVTTNVTGLQSVLI